MQKNVLWFITKSNKKTTDEKLNTWTYNDKDVIKIVTKSGIKLILDIKASL